jgi:hypothetical protein
MPYRTRHGKLQTNSPSQSFIIIIIIIIVSRDSSVSIALGYRLDDWGTRVRFPVGAVNLCLHHRVQNGMGPTQPM